MPLPDLNLADLRFQRDLVDEARKRIVRYCPEWTDYNLSDPGITLIELFAWMTEMTVFRLNRVPEKNYRHFLELLGVHLEPAQSARAYLTFRLSAPFPLNPGDETRALVPHALEVATQETPTTPQVVFTVDEALQIVPPRLLTLCTLEEFNVNYVDAIRPFVAFRRDPPEIGATFYLGFDPEDNLAGHIVRLAFTCERTEAVGVSRSDPPLVWEVSAGGGRWIELAPSRQPGEQDTTGGLNNESGAITFYLPEQAQPEYVQGLQRTWIRCRFEQRRDTQGRYSQSPRIRRVHAEALGASCWATHAVYREQEELGVSTGDAGQIFHLREAPLLALRGGETIEVEELRDGEIVYVPWQCVPDFAGSSQYDRHFTLDTSTGEAQFGPSIRQADGSVRQYGRVPQVGRRVRISRYRVGGGAIGNVPTGRIMVMRSAVPYIDRVVNSEAAFGGRDPETLDEAKMRSRRELRAQERAVTAEDYESLALKADRAVARARCLTPASTGGRLPPGMLELLLVPKAHEAVHVGDYARLQLASPLLRSVQQYMDGVRLLTTTLNLRAPSYLGVRVKARIVPNDVTPGDVAAARVVDALRAYIAPLPPLTGEIILPDPDSDEQWAGWPFGKPLYIAELYALIQRVRGVRHVLDVAVESRPLDLARERAGVSPLEEFAAQAVDARDTPPALTRLTGNMLAVAADTLLCSLDHEIEAVTL
jgi:predicted phage baseplate assembly protein